MIRILFVSQDPGSGNALFPVIKKLCQNSAFEVSVFATKYSKKIFKSQEVAFINMDERKLTESLMFFPDIIITGASAGNCIEKDAILFGKENGIPTISILDFWGNYTLRYSDMIKESNFRFLPDYILVMDETAKTQMITEGFLADKIIVTGNPYFDTFKISHSSNTKGNILYISQPIKVGDKYTKDSLHFEDFISVLKEILAEIVTKDIIPLEKQNIQITIRPHPKEEDYAYFTNSSLSLKIDTTTDIKELIQNSQIIIGKDSMVLFEAAFSGKTVISYQPLKQQDKLITNMLGFSHYVDTKTNLKKILCNIFTNTIKKNDLTEVNIKRPIISPYNDGCCTERVLNVIYKVLNNHG